MSRLPRHLEHLKTGFTAEAVSAATFRAFGEEAEGEGKLRLAAFWRRMAAEKDRLAMEQLRLAGRVGREAANLKAAIAEEQYEIEVLYPRLVEAMEHEGRRQEQELLSEVTEAQRSHLELLLEVSRELKIAAGGDIASEE